MLSSNHNGLLQQSRNVPAFIPVQHCLLFDFYTVFAKSESIAQNMVQGSSIRIEGALHLSKRYKAAIKRAIKMLEQPENNEGQSQAAVQALGEELCSAELLWSLIEAISIRPSHNLLVIDLLEWTCECFPSAQSQIPSTQEGMLSENTFLGPIMDELMQQERPELHESYWNAVIRQTLCADFPSVATLLQFHSAFKSDEALAKMVKILLAANADLFKSDRSNCDEFIKLQKKVLDLVTTKQLFRAHDNLGVICSLLIGDRGTFKKYFDLYRPNWFEVFPAFILYFHPTADGRQMPKIAESYFSLLGMGRRQLSKIEKTLLSIFELDLIQALRLICSGGQSTCWFATHLVDLLHFHDPSFLGASDQSKFLTCQTTNSNESENGNLSNLNLRSRLFIEYGQLLFRDSQLWEIGAEYMLASGVQNAHKMLDRNVGRLDWHGNGAMAERMLQICDRFELQNARENILKAITAKFCRHFEWSSALNWALRMENKELAVQVARTILQGAIPATRIGQMRIFESMSEQFVAAAELVLLYKFYTFKRRLFDGELRQAIQLLHELFLDTSAPIEFHVVLCEEMVRILTSFQRPLIGADALESTNLATIPGLDRDSVQDMFRALSKLQLQQNLLKAATAGEKELQQSALFPSAEMMKNMPEAEVYERLVDLMQILRPMLAEALASCSLH